MSVIINTLKNMDLSISDIKDTLIIVGGIIVGTVVGFISAYYAKERLGKNNVPRNYEGFGMMFTFAMNVIIIILLLILLQKN